jgi:hypothetical protein
MAAELKYNKSLVICIICLRKNSIQNSKETIHAKNYQTMFDNEVLPIMPTSLTIASPDGFY